MTPLEFGALFSLGLFSGLHCIQMCGPIAMVIGGPRAQLTYNAGRILTYTLLGGLAGAAGGGFGMLGRMAGLASGARIVAGAAMIVAGILMIGLVPAKGLVQLERRGITARFSRAIGKMLTGPGTKFRLGLMLGFLPCGLLYAALLKAMESAGVLSGALSMLAFGLGTAAALFGLGVASSFVRPPRWFAPLAIMLAGAVLLWRGLAAPHCHG
jgi:sulfite exporter TauE/SafE